MRSYSLYALALGFALLFVLVSVLTIPSRIDHLLEKPQDWKDQRQTLRQICGATVVKLKKRHGDKPVEEWPEADQQLWRSVNRVLADGGTKP